MVRPMARSNGDQKSPLHRFPDDTLPLDQGSVVGRYVILSQAGSGGMGVVYAAYDPQLDRKIAVKLLHPHRGGSEGRTRLLREAQAMARLSHPNVIAVHDVGTVGDQVFLAMEYVEGETLAEWLLREPRSWRRVLQVYRDAGGGLAAAHAVGLAHRDFKPSNVLVGADGRVRVLDFGMARPHLAPGEAAEKRERGRPSPQRLELPPSPLSTPVTEEGAVIGTLPYMAPEVPRMKGADARSDQFSFCVALYEALYGEHPFASAGDSTLDLIDRLLKGEVKPAPASSPVPGWLRRVLLRGMHTDPDQRYPSMDALLEALEEVPRRRRRLAAAIAGLLVALAGAGLAQVWVRSASAAAACRAGASRLDAVWNEARQDRIGALFSEVGAPFGEDAWRTVQAKVQSLAGTWSEQHRDACDDTHRRGQQSEDLLDRRMLCLDRRLTETDALLERFETADRSVVEEAPEAIERLPRPEECGDIEALLGAPRPPRDRQAREALRRTEAELAQAKALAAAGKYPEALTRAQAVVETADGLEQRGLQAEALVLAGEMHRWLGNGSDGANALVEAMWAAEASRKDRLAAEAARHLVWLLGVDQRLFLRAHYWVRLAEAKLDRAAGDVRELRADLDDAAGSLLRIEGRYAESLERHTRALETRQEIENASLEVASTSDYLASTLGSMGRHEEALVHRERALEILRRELGPEHPKLAQTLTNLGIELKYLGRYEEALEHQQEALDIFRSSLGPDHRFVVSALNNLATTLNEMDRYSEAEGYLAEALEVIQRNAGDGTPDPSQLTLTLFNQAATLQHLDRHAEAVGLFRQALELDEQELGASHPYVADDLFELATSLLAIGEAGEAARHLERALKIREETDAPPATVAATRFALAKALRQAGRDPERARRLAEQARELYREDSEHHREELTQVEAWLGNP